MSNRVVRVLLWSAVAAAVGTFGSLARAAFYDVGFDPDFDGAVQISIVDSCLSQADGTYSSNSEFCTVDLVFADVFPLPAGVPHYTSGPQSDIAFEVKIAGNELIAFDTFFADFPVSCGVECSGGLDFGIVPQNAYLTQCFGCGPVLIDPYTLSRVALPIPEPGTLGLLFGGVGAAWLARRRKTVA
jgi:hypothetical protein